MNKKIIIIGAGIAGLAAAKRLSEYGFDCLILEAKNQAGGRMITSHELGTPISRGASWIHGIDGNPIAELAKQFHVSMQPFESSQMTMYDHQGSVISSTEINEFDSMFDELLKQAKITTSQKGKDISLSDSLSSLIASAHFSPIKQDLFKAKLNYFQGYLGADYHLLSALHWDQEEIWPGEHCFLIDTYHPIIDGLTRHTVLQFNSIVKEINLQDNGVQIITEQNNYTADAVVITTPLGVLKMNSVVFNPPLPEDKKQAIQRIGMGLLNIVALKFPSIFWPKSNSSMFFANVDDLSISFFLNLYSFVQQPILIGYCGGDKARYLENLPDEVFIKKIIDNFKKTFGEKVPDPESYFITRWGRDPYSYGAYSYPAIGSSVKDFDKLAEPVHNRLFFAGEATSGKHFATTHGAYLSGIREAKNIKNRFSV